MHNTVIFKNLRRHSCNTTRSSLAPHKVPSAILFFSSRVFTSSPWLSPVGCRVGKFLGIKSKPGLNFTVCVVCVFIILVYASSNFFNRNYEHFLTSVCFET